MYSGGKPFDGLRAIANLYQESLHIVVRADSKIEAIADLRDKRISLGGRGSGTRATAVLVLGAYGVGERKFYGPAAHHREGDRAAARQRDRRHLPRRRTAGAGPGRTGADDGLAAAAGRRRRSLDPAQQLPVPHRRRHPREQLRHQSDDRDRGHRHLLAGARRTRRTTWFTTSRRRCGIRRRASCWIRAARSRAGSGSSRRSSACRCRSMPAPSASTRSRAIRAGSPATANRSASPWRRCDLPSSSD